MESDFALNLKVQKINFTNNTGSIGAYYNMPIRLISKSKLIFHTFRDFTHFNMQVLLHFFFKIMSPFGFFLLFYMFTEIVGRIISLTFELSA